MAAAASIVTRDTPTDAFVDACDCHMHVFDDRFPFAAGAPRVPNASVEAYQAVQRRLGLSRVVVVAPSNYGFDNRCVLDAAARFGDAARCVVSLDETSTPEQIAAWHAAGARGFRFNLVRSGMNRIETLGALSERVAGFGWHVLLLASAAQFITHAATLRALPIPVVLDHMARLPLEGGCDGALWQCITALLEHDSMWLKLSLASASPLLDSGNAESIHAPARALLAQAPERLIWGSDWPHVAATLDGHAWPDDARLLGLLGHWTPDPAVRRRVLVDNPQTLYGF